MGNPGQPVGIPRWLTVANILGIVMAFVLAIPFGARANHQSAPTNPGIIRPPIPAGTAETAFKLTWSDPGAAGATQYALQRSTSSTFNANVVEYRIARNTFEFWDETRTKVGTFYYRVASISGVDRSAYANFPVRSNNTALTVPPAPGCSPQPCPVRDLATEASPNGVRVTWIDDTPHETFWRVERGRAEQGQNLTWEWRWNLAFKTGTGQRLSFIDPDGNVGDAYRVTALNTAGSWRSHAVVHTQPNVAGVDVNGVNSMVNSLVSAAPTNLTSLVPSNALGTVNAIVSPFVSAATAAVPSDAAGTVNAIASPWTSLATALASGVTSFVPAPSGVVDTVNAFVSIGNAIASPFVSMAGSVIANPTGVLDPVKIWFGIRFFGGNYLPSIWLWPSSCAPSICNPPANNDPFLQCIPSGFNIDFCYLLRLG